MQPVTNAVAEIVKLATGFVSYFGPRFSPRAVTEGRRGEAQHQHQRGADHEDAATTGDARISRDAGMAEG
jgi:hypothetical protein